MINKKKNSCILWSFHFSFITDGFVDTFKNRFPYKIIEGAIHVPVMMHFTYSCFSIIGI